jgi:hypothetical protein
MTIFDDTRSSAGGDAGVNYALHIGEARGHSE